TFLGSYRLFSDLKLQVNIAKQKVIARYVAHQSQYYGLLRVLSAEQLGPGRFGRAPIASEQIHLKDHVGSERKNIGLDVLLGLSAAEIRVHGNLRELVGAHDADLGPCGDDALHRQLQVIVLLQRRADQFLQLRIVTGLPPRQVG